MKNLLLALTVFLTTFSCTLKNFDQPDNLIGKSDMIDILTDLYISQQGLQLFPDQNANQTLKLAEDAIDIIKSYEYNYHDFEESYKYYAMQPEKFKEMLDDVKQNLEDKLSDEEKARLKENATDSQEEPQLQKAEPR